MASSYTDARFRDYAVGAADYSGNRIPGIAPHRFDGTVTLQNRGGAFVETEARYLASLPVDDANLHRSAATTTPPSPSTPSAAATMRQAHARI